MKRFTIAALLLISLVACDKKRGMESRTYELTRLTTDEASALLTPYIREGGYISSKGRYMTVTERPDRLKLIGELIEQYDGSADPLDIQLDVQVIEANGFDKPDSAIADVESTLRETFKYRGYRLIGATSIRTREDAEFVQKTPVFSIRGRVQRMRGKPGEKRVPITIQLQTEDTEMTSTITGTVGKPLVLGQGNAKGGAIILVVRPSEVP
jgi:hypothetical protein